MRKIDSSFIVNVSKEAKNNARRRMNYNFHKQPDDKLQRLLNAMEPGTYVRPHKHEDPDKREVFIIFSGKAVVIEFDDNGKITDHFILDSESGNFALEIAERTWHSIICLKENTVLYEVKDGPYFQPTDKDFASWAPAEGSANCAEYNNHILKELSLI